MFSREKAEKIAKDFLKEMNPTNWNGRGRKPKSFDERVMTFDIDSINGNELDISFEYLEKDESDVTGWTHYCALVDKETGLTVAPLHGYDIDSLQNLIDTIMDICSEEN